jgi:hypothetical protein
MTEMNRMTGIDEVAMSVRTAMCNGRHHGGKIVSIAATDKSRNTAHQAEGGPDICSRTA